MSNLVLDFIGDFDVLARGKLAIFIFGVVHILEHFEHDLVAARSGIGEFEMIFGSSRYCGNHLTIPLHSPLKSRPPVVGDLAASHSTTFQPDLRLGRPFEFLFHEHGLHDIEFPGRLVLVFDTLDDTVITRGLHYGSMKNHRGVTETRFCGWRKWPLRRINWISTILAR